MKWFHLAVVLAGIIAGPSVSASIAQSMSIIDGIVLDAGTGEPLSGVRIGLVAEGAAPLGVDPGTDRTLLTPATTDERGRFSFETGEIGRIRVVPLKRGYVYSPSQTRIAVDPGAWVQLSPGARIQSLNLRMTRPAVITGRAVDAEGQPIVGTAGSVRLMQYSYGTDGIRKLNSSTGISYASTSGWTLRMNDLGEFRFYDLPPGEYYLGVLAGGGPIGSSPIYYYPGVTDEAKAMPIRAASGEEIRLETLVLPPRPKGVEVRIRFPGNPQFSPAGRWIHFGDSKLIFPSPPDPSELVLSVAPGHYDVVVSDDALSIQRPSLIYGSASLDVTSSNTAVQIELKPGPRVTSTLLLENEAGERSVASFVRCRLSSRYGLLNCASAQFVPGHYEIEFEGLPKDSYLLSAKVGEKDVLAEGLDMIGDTQLEIVFGSKGGVIEGTVRNAIGDIMLEAVVALVPDAPYRKAGLLYKSVVTDHNGQFEIHGVAPGGYKLFAWSALAGAAYRNADFLKEFEDSGKPAKVDKGGRLSVDLTAF